jgi:trimethylamine--corrinoid protein Co-methyltransferase
LLERTNVFCPEQAILDDAHIAMVKPMLRAPEVDTGQREAVVALVREVMESSHKTFMYHLPLPTRDSVYVRYPLEDSESGALAAAHRRYQEVLERPRNAIPAELRNDILGRIPGLLYTTVRQLEEAVP